MYPVQHVGPAHDVVTGRLRHTPTDESDEEIDFIKATKSQVASGVATFVCIN